jgi:hypothetical protein
MVAEMPQWAVICCCVPLLAEAPLTRKPADCTMDDLTTRLESLLQCLRPDAQAERMGEQFRRELEVLIAQYGFEAVNVALDALAGDTTPSASLH